MEYFVPPVTFNRANDVPQAPAQRQESAAEALSSMFLQTMLKEIYKSQFKNGLFQDENDASSSYFSEVFVDQMIDQLSRDDAFGLNEMIASDFKKKM